MLGGAAVYDPNNGGKYYHYTVLNQHLATEQLLVEKCLREANCGAEVALAPSGHPVWRIPVDQVYKLPKVAPENKVAEWSSGHGIPATDDFGRRQVAELIRHYDRYWTEDMLGPWKPITAVVAAKRGKKRERKSSKVTA